MKKSRWSRVLAVLLAAVLTVGMTATTVFATTEYEDSSQETGTLVNTVYSSTSYLAYLASQTALRRESLPSVDDKNNLTDEEVRDRFTQPVGTEFQVDIGNFTLSDSSMRPEVYLNGVTLSGNTQLEGYSSILADLIGGGTTLYLPEEGTVSWEIDVGDQAGFYGICIEYYPLSLSGKISSAEKKLMVDDELLFSECTSLTFNKNWAYSYHYTEDASGLYILTTNDTYMLKADADVKGLTSKDGKTYTRGFVRDVNGNDIRSDAYESPSWMTYTLKDANGFTNDNLEIYFSAGKHTISLAGSREGLLIHSISLFVVEDELSYDEYTSSVAGRTDNAGSIVKLEGEYPDMVSDSSVYASNDRSSAITSPSDPSAQLLNVIGKASYSTVGQWAAYRFTVTEDGYYNLAARFKQTALEGMFASRVLKLASSDGEFGYADGTPKVPFSEAYNVRFTYKNGWQTTQLGYYDESNTLHPFTFYFKKGVVYTLTMEVGLGDMAEIISTVQNSLSTINDCYLNILKLTGTSPDEYRDYGFNRVMPNTVKNLTAQAEVLNDVVNKMKDICGTIGSNTATLTIIAELLERMGKDEKEIAANLDNLKSYIGNLGTWLNTVKAQSVSLDYLTVQPDGSKLPQAEANFFQSAWFEISAFVASFFTDYNSMGIRDEADKVGTIDVWLAYGRDQSQIWRNLIDDEFTAKTKVAVTLKLVTAGTLLPSVLCGQGPDVYIGLAAGETINYAIRSAVVPLSQFEDLSSYDKLSNPEIPTGYEKTLSEVKSQFTASALVPLTLYDETYGVPETSSFNMMFVRNDIMENLGLDVPETWDDVLAAIPVLQANNMMVGINYASAFQIFLYQQGGGLWLYNGTDGYPMDPDYAGAEIGIATNTALSAFTDICRLYTDYSFPVTFDGPNRFRTGEMPLLIADYVATYNQLTVFATEISGVWQFTMIPGTERLQYNADGTPEYDNEGNQKTYIDHSSMTVITSTIMLHSNSRTHDETGYAWEFMVWQSSAEAQAEYGNKMVALIGPSAKYATANVKAIENLSWTSTELANIKAQLNQLAAIENYPGAYYITRYIQFAFLDAYNDGMDPAEAMQGYEHAINKEIERKREEFDLKILDGRTPEEARAEEQR